MTGSRRGVQHPAPARFALEVGMVPLTGTTDPGRMRADLDVFDFRLAPEEVERIERLGLP